MPPDTEELTEAEIDKLYDKLKLPGPGTHEPEHNLTEKRPDVGVPKFV